MELSELRAIVPEGKAGMSGNRFRWCPKYWPKHANYGGKKDTNIDKQYTMNQMELNVIANRCLSKHGLFWGVPVSHFSSSRLNSL